MQTKSVSLHCAIRSLIIRKILPLCLPWDVERGIFANEFHASIPQTQIFPLPLLNHSKKLFAVTFRDGNSHVADDNSFALNGIDFVDGDHP